jgi:large subunit ribosomal protein L21
MVVVYTELVVQKVNETLHRDDLGRLFAVIHIQSKQRKVTNEDLLVVEGYIYPNVGEGKRIINYHVF